MGNNMQKVTESRYNNLLRHIIRSYHYPTEHKLIWFLGIILIYLVATFYHILAPAETDTAFLRVAAYVSPSCIIEAPPTTLNFGTFHLAYSKKANATKTSTSLNMTCTKGIIALLRINEGEHANNTNRQMINEKSSYLSYNLYTSADNSVILNKERIVRYEATSTSPYSVVIFAYIPPGEYIQAGTYKDNVIVTVRFLPAGAIRSFNLLVTIVFVPDEQMYDQLIASR